MSGMQEASLDNAEEATRAPDLSHVCGVHIWEDLGPCGPGRGCRHFCSGKAPTRFLGVSPADRDTCVVCVDLWEHATHSRAPR